MKDLKFDNTLVDLRHVEPTHEQQVNTLGYKALINPTISPESAVLSRPLHQFNLVEIDELIKISKFNIRLTDFGTGKSLVWNGTLRGTIIVNRSCHS